MARKDTRQYSLDDLKTMRACGAYVPTKPEAPAAELGEEFWQNAHVVMPLSKASAHLCGWPSGDIERSRKTRPN